ncbi:prevent-host-death family protein [Streptosporangium lutulentum]|uniref:Prevent-host-death family protein n=1 Tax=Streptosporangium lutulentum TaxID=1461250 RepID=A0ABT9QU79_9ACTN|nr:type II toxin-antitoxin system prevent-host-death family antitoxin [Streptosporangium lutulentum]MDP9850305.1 prevent-host-death family protein [Streptosporangium lutulentum]
MDEADKRGAASAAGEVEEIGIREARARLADLVERAGTGQPVVLRRRGPYRNAAALLPIQAVVVWQVHLAARDAERERRAQETALGERLPIGSRVAVCPLCRSSFMHVVFTGPVVIALVNTADPAAGVQAVVADTDVTASEQVAFVRCASCWEPMNERPREHGSPAYRAAVAIAQEASWADVPWETREAYVVREEDMGRASRIVLAHDLARGKLRRVTRWEWLTGITDDEREQLRRELDDDA